MLKIRDKKKGFTLLEVVVSVTILAIIVAPILSMVLTSVKTNKQSEDKQKALYIAQQTVEQQKSDLTINTETTTTINEGFTVKKTVVELTDYKFPDVNTNINTSTTNTSDVSNNSPKTFSDIVYDTKLEVNSTNDGTTLKIMYYNQNDKNENYKELSLKSSSNILNITNYDGYIIINVNKDDNTKIEEDPNRIVSYKVSSSQNTKIGNVIIQYNTDTQPDIKIHGLNNCDQDLIFYFATSKDKQFNYSLINDGGKIKSYYDIFEADSGNPYRNNSRVYRIDVEVSKDGKSLQKMTAFKIAAE